MLTLILSEPCPLNFTRVGTDCYHFGSDTGREYDWKFSSKQCKKLGGYLAETEGTDKMGTLASYILSKTHLSGKILMFSKLQTNTNILFYIFTRKGLLVGWIKSWTSFHLEHECKTCT